MISYKSELEQSTSCNVTYVFFHPGVDKKKTCILIHLLDF